MKKYFSRVGIFRNKIKHFIFNFANGIYSRIPICCVWFFSMHSFKGTQSIAKTIHDKRDPKINFQDKESCGYVRCDSCYNNDYEREINFTNGSILKTFNKRHNEKSFQTTY